MTIKKMDPGERNRVMFAMFSELDLEKLLEMIVTKIPELVGTQGCSIFLKNENRGDYEMVQTSGLLEMKPKDRVAYDAGEGLTGWVCKHGLPLRIRNVMDEKELAAKAPDLRWTRKFSEVQSDYGLAYLAVPLKSTKGDVFGVIRVSHKLGDVSFDQDDQNILESIASKVALAIENATLYQAEKHKAEYLELLHKVGTQVRSVSDWSELLGVVAEQTAETFSAETCEIYLKDDAESDLLIMRAGYNIPQDLINRAEHKVGEGITGWIAESGEIMRTENVLKLSQYKGKYRDEIAPHLEYGDRLTFIGLPLKCRGKVLGVIKLYNKIAPEGVLQYFTEEDERYLQILADEVAVAIENVALFQSEKRRNRYLELLTVRGVELGSEVPNIDRLLNKAVVDAAQTFSAEACEIYLRDDVEPDRLIMRAGYNVPKHLINRAEHKMGEGVTGWIAERGEIVRTENVQELPQYKGKYCDQILLYLKHGSRSAFLGLPLRSRGKVIGVMKLYKRLEKNKENQFTEEDARYAEILSDEIAVVIENAKYVQNLHDMAVQAIQMQRLTSLGTLAVRLPNRVESALTTARLAVENLKREISARFPEDKALGTWLKDRLRNVREPLDEVDKSIGVLRTFSTKVGLVKIPSRWARLLDQSLLFVRGSAIMKKVEIRRIRDHQETLPLILVEPSQMIGIIVTVLQILIRRLRNYGGTIMIQPQLSFDKNFLTVQFTGIEGDKEHPIEGNIPVGDTNMNEYLDPLRLALDVARNTIQREYEGDIEYKHEGRDRATFTLDVKVLKAMTVADREDLDGF